MFAARAALAIVLTISLVAGPADAAKKKHVKIPALVNVDLRNVLNNLSVRLHLDRTNVPVNAQIPITLAANVCGVSVNVLAVSAANGKGHCVAKNASPKLAQVVQQQISAGGDVGGGAQGGSTATTGGTRQSPSSSSAKSSGSTGTATPRPPRSR